MTKGVKKNPIRYMYGETNTIEIPVKTVKASECNEIAEFDPVYLNRSTKTNAGNRNFAYPIGALATASVADTAKTYFAGISLTHSRDGDNADIQVARSGIFKIPLNTATSVNVGDLARFVTGVGAASGSVDVDACQISTDNGTYRNDAFGKVVEKGTSVSYALVEISAIGLGASLDFVPTG